MKTTKLSKLQSGVGLVEIMIAMVIGLFLVGGLMHMFLNSKKVYKLQDSISRLQENGRFAMDFLVHDVRDIGSWGCFNDTANIESLLNSGSVFDAFANGIAGQDNQTVTGILAKPDSVSFYRTTALQDPNGVDVTVKDIPASTSADLKISANSGIAANDIVFVGDCEDANLFQVTNISTSSGANGRDNVVHNTGTGTPGNWSNKLIKKYDTNARLYKASFVTYSIQPGESGEPSLFKQQNGDTAQELIEGVEDMQILYGEDTDADGTPNYYVTANQVENMQHVVSLEVSLLAHSLDDKLTGSPIAYTYNGVTVTPTDHRIRRVFSTLITIRNRLF